MTSLFTIASQYRADLAVLADLDVDPQTASDTLEGLQGELQDKLRAVIAYSLELDVLAVGASEAAKRMADRAKALDARVQWLRQYALTAMRDCGLSEVSTDEWAAKLAKKPGAVNITDPALIPPAYLRTPEPPQPQPDKKAIADAIKAGTAVPGAELVTGYRLALK